MAGYSATPLLKKLGIKDESRVSVIAFPKDGPDELASYKALSEGNLDVTVYFTKSGNELDAAYPSLIANTAQNGCIWISWPKKSSGVATDLNENIVRDLGLAAGIVDVKVCAIDDVWSGLKFVRRLRDRI